VRHLVFGSRHMHARTRGEGQAEDALSDAFGILGGRRTGPNGNASRAAFEDRDAHVDSGLVRHAAMLEVRPTVEDVRKRTSVDVLSISDRLMTRILQYRLLTTERARSVRKRSASTARTTVRCTKEPRGILYDPVVHIRGLHRRRAAELGWRNRCSCNVAGPPRHEERGLCRTAEPI
jgi:hypothetical protein